MKSSIETIPRGADLTDDDLKQIVDDFIIVRNWAALSMRMKPEPIKEELLKALKVRLGRLPFSEDGSPIG